MRVGLRLLAAALAWRGTGLPAAGRALVDALSGDEQERTIAGMGLVQAGERSVPLIEAEIRSRGPSAILVRVLADVPCASSRRTLAEVAGGTGDVADLARDLLTQMDGEDDD